MNAYCCRHPQRPWPALGWLCLAVGSTLLCGRASAADVARVEEDWQLVVNQPDVDLNGPQVTCVISPSTADVAYCAFDVNYHTQPDYSPGGMQLHAWDPGSPIVTCDLPEAGVMQQANETVTWTQTMSLTEGVLSFAVVNGQSVTWGSFGGGDQTWVSVNTTLANLNGYDPQVSLTNSGVSFASNLVTSLTLTAVRYYAADGTLIQQVTTPQVVHPQD
ncbi:MAG TPA: hypothetical protein VNH11_03320 [Pirellulales bacterium]|nr:hypothetical protein [Pirellulales bacterium]